MTSSDAALAFELADENDKAEIECHGDGMQSRNAVGFFGACLSAVCA